MTAPRQTNHAVQTLHYAAPIIVFIYHLAAAAWSICSLQTLEAKPRSKLRNAVLPATFIVSLTFASEAGVIIAQILTSSSPFATTDSNVYALSGALLWIFLFASLLGSKQHLWYPYHGAWALALVADVVISGLEATDFLPSNSMEWAQLSLRIFRIIVIMLMLVLFFALGRLSYSEDEEALPLLGASNASENSHVRGSTYGSIDTTESDENAALETNDDEAARSERETKEKLALLKARLRENGSWWTYLKGFSVFFPYIWPTGRPLLQFNMAGVALCVLATRAVNILAPRQLGILTNALGDGAAKEAFVALGIYTALEWMKSYAGIEGLRSWLWLPVESHAALSLDIASYNHIMDLSCDFHDQKRSGELYAAMNQGASIIDLLETILYLLLPQVLDLLIACVYFYFLLDVYLVLIVVAVMVAYFWLSVHTAFNQADLRRKNNVAGRRKHQVMYDTMGGWRTVSYFNRIPHARQTYAISVRLFQRIVKQYAKSWVITFGLQSVVLEVGGFGALVYGTYQIAYGGKSVGTFVTLLNYWATITGNLPYLATIHRSFMRRLVDAEELLRLFRTKPSIRDGPNEFCVHGGHVIFEKVCFSYDNKKDNIKDLSFSTRQGQKIALVGETGAGKSTILKLLFRFYDVSSGSISIDGQDIRTVTLDSLRDQIGVVPQDASLFNDTIVANVRYAKLDATDEEVMSACKAAAIHEKILSFTDGYQTKVGEHGVKLSGGELQRIAIARAILKDPKIILLDEATSSVDSETEGKIQEGLKRLSQGRTTFVVAHRLSTIMDSDVIIVIKDGAILEEGSPKELLGKGKKGKYYRLWTKQMGILDTTAFTEDESSVNQALQSSEPSSPSSRSGTTSRYQGGKFVQTHEEQVWQIQLIRMKLELRGRPCGDGASEDSIQAAIQQREALPSDPPADPQEKKMFEMRHMLASVAEELKKSRIVALSHNQPHKVKNEIGEGNQQSHIQKQSVKGQQTPASGSSVKSPFRPQAPEFVPQSQQESGGSDKGRALPNQDDFVGLRAEDASGAGSDYSLSKSDPKETRPSRRQEARSDPGYQSGRGSAAGQLDGSDVGFRENVTKNHSRRGSVAPPGKRRRRGRGRGMSASVESSHSGTASSRTGSGNWATSTQSGNTIPMPGAPRLPQAELAYPANHACPSAPGAP